MAESKRTGIKGSMNKDLDDRLVPEGFFRDALNVSVGHSEGSDVGAIENVRGNAVPIAQTNITGTVIGSTVDDETGNIYWFVVSANQDAIYEYNATTNAVSTVLIDSRAFTGDGDDGGDNGGGDGGVETWTVTGTINGTEVAEPAVGGYEQYSIDISTVATSTSSTGSIRSVNTFLYEEIDSAGAGGTALASQPTGFGSSSSSSVISTPNSNRPASATNRYFRVTLTDSGVPASTTILYVTVAISAQTVALDVSFSLPSSFTSGDTITLNSTPIGGVPGYTYAWSGPNGFSSTSQNTSISNASSANAGTYTISVTDSNSNSTSQSRTNSMTSFGYPSVTTVIVSQSGNQGELTMNGFVNNGGANGGVVTARGFYYLKNTTGTTYAASTVIANGTKNTEPSGTGNGAYSVLQSGLDANSTYDCVAWASNGSLEDQGVVKSNTTQPAGTQTIVANPTSLGDKPAASASYQVDLTLTNLPNSLITPTITYVTGGSGWIASVTRRSGTDTYDITFGTMTAPTATSPTFRIAQVRFTNPTTGISTDVACSQTLGAAISITATNGLTSFNKLGGFNGFPVTVAFDPAGTVQGQWRFKDSLPNWIHLGSSATGVHTHNTSYLGDFNAQSFFFDYNNSGGARSHTFDVRIMDEYEDDLTAPGVAVRDTITISQDLSVPTTMYEYNGVANAKTGITTVKSNGSFHTASFSGGQGGNTNDNVLRITVTPLAPNQAEIATVKYYITPSTGGYNTSAFPNAWDPWFNVNGSMVSGVGSANAITLGTTGGVYNLAITSRGASPFTNGSYAQIIRSITVIATTDGGTTSSKTFSLGQTF